MKWIHSLAVSLPLPHRFPSFPPSLRTFRLPISEAEITHSPTRFGVELPTYWLLVHTNIPNWIGLITIEKGCDVKSVSILRLRCAPPPKWIEGDSASSSLSSLQTRRQMTVFAYFPLSLPSRPLPTPDSLRTGAIFAFFRAR